ncbi:hypothetical protein Tco_0880747 [Tanacetum coccineum]
MVAGKRVQYDGRHRDDEKLITGEKPEVFEIKQSCPPSRQWAPKKRNATTAVGILHKEFQKLKSKQLCFNLIQLALRLSDEGFYVMEPFESDKEWGVIRYPRQVLFVASLLKTNHALHEAVVSAMSNKATVIECIEAIEKAVA